MPVDVDFRAAYLLIGRDIGAGRATARLDGFMIHDNSYQFADNNAEHGWAATLAYKRSFGRHIDAVAELLHVESDRPGRALYGAVPEQQAQTLAQASLRLHL